MSDESTDEVEGTCPWCLKDVLDSDETETVCYDEAGNVWHRRCWQAGDPTTVTPTQQHGGNEG